MSYKDEFTELTGITLKVDTYQEQQMRQRLMTVLNSASDEVDVFMTLASREGQQFAAAGWYADLSAYAKSDVAPEYDFAGISPALVKAATFDGMLTSIPLNLEGPLLYYRTDIFEKCGIAKPASLDDVRAAAEKVKTCDSGVTPFASRGLKPAIAYTFSNVLHNVGGTYIVDGKSALCSPEGKKAISFYGDLMREFGSPGAANYSFYQISALYRSGRAAMAFESSNELRTIMEGGERLADTDVIPLPAGEARFRRRSAGGWRSPITARRRMPPGTSSSGPPARKSRSAWRFRALPRRARPLRRTPNTRHGSAKLLSGQAGRQRLMSLPPTDPRKSAIRSSPTPNRATTSVRRSRTCSSVRSLSMRLVPRRTPLSTG